MLNKLVSIFSHKTVAAAVVPAVHQRIASFTVLWLPGVLMQAVEAGGVHRSKEYIIEYAACVNKYHSSYEASSHKDYIQWERKMEEYSDNGWVTLNLCDPFIFNN